MLSYRPGQISGHSHAGPSESMASAQTGMFTAAGRGLQTSYSSRMSTQQPQQQGGYNAAQTKVEVLVYAAVNLMEICPFISH